MIIFRSLIPFFDFSDATLRPANVSRALLTYAILSSERVKTEALIKEYRKLNAARKRGKARNYSGIPKTRGRCWILGGADSSSIETCLGLN